MMTTSRDETLIGNSDFTNTVSQALRLKRTVRELNETRANVEVLRERLDAADRAARDASVQHAADMARVEGQRDELSGLLRDKTEELAAATERIEKVERELQSATDTIERLREEVAMRNTDPLHVQVRHGNAYDALLEQAVKNSGKQNALVELYRNIETHTSNMRWQTFLNETALNVRNLLSVFMRCDLSKKLSEKAMVEKMLAETERLQPPLIGYAQRHLEFEENKKKKLTKVQMQTFQTPLQKALELLASAWVEDMKKNQSNGVMFY